MPNLAKQTYQNNEEDYDHWENGDYGKNPRHVKRVSEQKATEIDRNLGLQSITIRLQRDLLEELKVLAKDAGLGYQPYIRHILTKHVKKPAQNE